jgi:tetratricopeptide (TPR) repeat protein
VLARERLGGGVCEGEAALELLRRSLEIDDGYAPAWEALGWAEYGLAASCAGDSSHYQNALRSADRALAISPDWISAIGLKATVLVETGRAEDAYAVLTAAHGRVPGNVDLYSQLFYVLEYAGFVGEAARWLDKLLAADPNYLTDRGWTPNPYLYRGEYERFLRHLPGTDAPLFRFYHGLAEVSRGNHDAARQVLEPAFRLKPSDVFAQLSAALLATLDGKPEESQAILRNVLRQREALRATDGEMSFKIAQLLVFAGQPDEGMRTLSQAVSQGFFCVSCLDGDPLLHPVHGRSDFAAARRRALERHERFGRRFGLRD